MGGAGDQHVIILPQVSWHTVGKGSDETYSLNHLSQDSEDTASSR